jgi:uncharacterized membrane protein (DUF485 family)
MWPCSRESDITNLKNEGDDEMAEQQQVDYVSVVKSAKFQTMVRAKKRFIIPMTIFFMVFYFALPFTTSFSTVLNTSFVGAITWAWVFAFAQFIMTWALCHIYSWKAKKFDVVAEELKVELGFADGEQAQIKGIRQKGQSDQTIDGGLNQ